MAERSQHEDIARLPIHFDVPVNFFTADDYLVAIESFRTCLNELNKRVFKDGIDCELVILANEDGSFISVTGVLVRRTGKVIAAAGILGGLLSFSELDLFKGFYKGLTGKELNHAALGEEAGSTLREMLKGFFQTEAEDLEKIIPRGTNLDKALKAKTDFYSMCIQNPAINGVGFEATERFSVKRSQFPYHVSRDKVRPAASEFAVMELTVISPVDVDKNLQWTFQDTTTRKSVRAYMKDEAFKRDFLSGKYPLKRTKLDDRMTVMLEIEMQEKNGELEVKDRNIVTVYSFNKEKLAPVPLDAGRNNQVSLSDTRPMDGIWGVH